MVAEYASGVSIPSFLAVVASCGAATDGQFRRCGAPCARISRCAARGTSSTRTSTPSARHVTGQRGIGDQAVALGNQAGEAIARHLVGIATDISEQRVCRCRNLYWPTVAKVTSCRSFAQAIGAENLRNKCHAAR